MNGINEWIWYYGDFELYHSRRLHSRRAERDYVFPAFWNIPEVYSGVSFSAKLTVGSAGYINAHANGVGYVGVGGKKYPFDSDIPLPEGDIWVSLYVNNISGLPCAYVSGGGIEAVDGWFADCYGGGRRRAGSDPHYRDINVTPETFYFEYDKIAPASVTQTQGGVLYDFGRETFARVTAEKLPYGTTLYLGETAEEATDTAHSYVTLTCDDKNTEKNREAYGFRYIFIPGIAPCDAELGVFYEHLPAVSRGAFSCSDETLNKIWDVAAYTFTLNSREFYLDGIKRDRWVWSGDAYQSYFINRYLYADFDIAKRTVTALGGKGEIFSHINTILDYTLYYIMSVYDVYYASGDADFLSRSYPRMRDMMEFCLSRLNADGFADRVDGDWIFVDWADMDKDGPVAAEQILLRRALEYYALTLDTLGLDGKPYRDMATALGEKIDGFFWDDERGAYIDCAASGKKNVTRHANIFALLFDFADDKRRQKIIDSVILNDAVPAITTPYFKFYELEAMCRIGRLEYVYERIKAYWGAMINAGATTFWEEYSPELEPGAQLAMYGDKYGKSLCHAWGASPVYLLGRYFLGVAPTGVGYSTFEVRPALTIDAMSRINATVPVGCRGNVVIVRNGDTLTVTADCDGGTLFCRGEHPLHAGEPLTITL